MDRAGDSAAAAGRGSVTEVHEQICQAREMAYTTVMTVMGRLAEKGFLGMEQGSGCHGHVYTPTLTRTEFMALAIEKLFGDLQATKPERSQVLSALNTPASPHSVASTG